MSEAGNIIAYTNLKKKQGDKLPGFTGKLTLPESTAERGVSLWPNVSKRTGHIVISGRVRADANDQIALMATDAPKIDADQVIEIMQTDGNALRVEPNSLVMFQNKSKAQNPNRPDMYGFLNPGKGQPLMRMSVWSRVDRNGNAYLSGSVQKHEPRPEKGLEEGPDASVDDEPEPDMRVKKAKKPGR